MSQSFSYDFSLAGSPTDAQARVQGNVTEQMRQAAKMPLACQDSNSVSFRPQLSWPLLSALFRVIGGEGVTLNFTAAAGGTHVIVAGQGWRRREGLDSRVLGTGSQRGLRSLPREHRSW